MATEYSFDIVAEVDFTEIQNAHQTALKQIVNRYDFKGKTCTLELKKAEKEVISEGSDEYVVDAMMEIFTTALAKRGVDLRALEEKGAKEMAPGGNVRKKWTIRDSLNQEEAKKVTKAIKEGKYKVQASIQGDTVRVKSASKDVLQEVMAMVKTLELNAPVKFTNYR